MPAVNPVWPAALCAEPGARSRAAFSFPERSRRASASSPAAPRGFPATAAPSSPLSAPCFQSASCPIPARNPREFIFIPPPSARLARSNQKTKWKGPGIFKSNTCPTPRRAQPNGIKWLGKGHSPGGSLAQRPARPATRPPNPRATIAPLPQRAWQSSRRWRPRPGFSPKEAP